MKTKLGIGKFRIKMIQHQDEEIIAKATQELDEVNIRLTQLKGDRARSIELTERELHRILLMVGDIRRTTGQDCPVEDDLTFNPD